MYKKELEYAKDELKLALSLLRGKNDDYSKVLDVRDICEGICNIINKN